MWFLYYNFSNKDDYWVCNKTKWWETCLHHFKAHIKQWESCVERLFSFTVCFYLEQCVPSRCRLQSGWQVEVDPVGIVSDHHTTSAGPAAPGPQRGDLNPNILWEIQQGRQKTEPSTKHEDTHRHQSTAEHQALLQQWSFCRGWGCPNL